MSTMEPLSRTILRKLIVFFAFLMLLIFAPALSLAYWQGWLHWLIFCALTLASTRYFLLHDPALIRRRLHAGATAEREPAQQVIMAIASVALIAVYVISGLDHQRQWPHVPAWIVIAANAAFVLGYALMFLTLKTNTFAASTITVEAGQHVVSSGPYAHVRHPMYSRS
ncbi:MAG TPA: isoprenylcysteine carboxylmethyltransferase family protein [Xanthobacteraceae bacterium]|nr:isoprenylcysteine carboxylmethyltransferase family protein [Xanthobacteraceae bacterium]